MAHESPLPLQVGTILFLRKHGDEDGQYFYASIRLLFTKCLDAIWDHTHEAMFWAALQSRYLPVKLHTRGHPKHKKDQPNLLWWFRVVALRETGINIIKAVRTRAPAFAGVHVCWAVVVSTFTHACSQACSRTRGGRGGGACSHRHDFERTYFAGTVRTHAIHDLGTRRCRRRRCPRASCVLVLAVNSCFAFSLYFASIIVVFFSASQFRWRPPTAQIHVVIFECGTWLFIIKFCDT